MLCCLLKGEEDRCFCFSSFLSGYKAATRDLMFLNSWVRHSRASEVDSYPENNMYTLYTQMFYHRLIVNLRKTECKEEPIGRKLYLQIFTSYTKNCELIDLCCCGSPPGNVFLFVVYFLAFSWTGGVWSWWSEWKQCVTCASTKTDLPPSPCIICYFTGISIGFVWSNFVYISTKFVKIFDARCLGGSVF